MCNLNRNWDVYEMILSIDLDKLKCGCEGLDCECNGDECSIYGCGNYKKCIRCEIMHKLDVLDKSFTSAIVDSSPLMGFVESQTDLPPEFKKVLDDN